MKLDERLTLPEILYPNYNVETNEPMKWTIDAVRVTWMWFGFMFNKLLTLLI